MGDSTAVTDSLCPERPERGIGVAWVVAWVLCDWLGCEAVKRIPKQRIAAVCSIRQTCVVFVFRLLISTNLVPN